jgi:signal transduction histidine kinase
MSAPGLPYLVTERLRELDVLQGAIVATSEASEPDQVLHACMDTICELTGWPLAHAYLLSRPDGQSMQASDICRWDSREHFELLRSLRNTVAVKREEGFVGKVWASAEPLWAFHSSNARCSEVEPPAAAAGFGFVFGLPIDALGDVVAVLQFFAVEEDPPTEPSMQLIRALGNWAGRAVERCLVRDDLVESNGRLAERVAMLENADKHKNEFLAMLGHELRNPLAAIQGGVSVLQQRGADAPAFGRTCRMVLDEVQHIAHLLEDLLDLARISRGQMKLNRRHVLLEDIVNRAVEATMPLINSNRQTLEYDVEKGIALYADPTRVEQIIINLLDNASRYSQPATPIALRAKMHAGEARVVVADQGKGFSSEQARHLFEPFRVSSGEDREGGGLGIGLGLIKELAELHGGTVAASSSGPAKGSQFVVTLPLAEQGPMRPREDPKR